MIIQNETIVFFVAFKLAIWSHAQDEVMKPRYGSELERILAFIHSLNSTLSCTIFSF